MDFLEPKDHCMQMMRKMFDFSRKENLTDMSIIADDTTFFVHKCILAAASSTLHDMIQRESQEPGKLQNQIQISIHGVTVSGMRDLIAYIYTGESPNAIDSDEKDEFKDACDAVGIRTSAPTNKPDPDDFEHISEEGTDEQPVDSDKSQVIIQIIEPDDMDYSDEEMVSTTDTETSSSDEDCEDSSAACSVTKNNIFRKPSPKRIKLINDKPIKPNIVGDVDISALFTVQKRGDEVSVLCDSNINKPMTFDPSKALKQGRPRLANDYLFPKHPPYICPKELCDKEFETREKLKKHYRTHDERTHVCGQCDKRFLHNKDLVNHLRIHTGEKPFTCELCEASFAQNSTLSYHMKTHSERRTEFICGQCDQKFKTPKGLQNHVEKLHNGGLTVAEKEKKPHVCPICDRRFQLLKSIWQHMKLQHPDSEEYKVIAAHRENKKVQQNSSKVQSVPMFQPAYEIHESDGQTVLEFTEVKGGISESGEPQFFCTACGESFSEDEYIDHIDSCKEAGQPTCGNCGEFFKTIEEREAHVCEIQTKSDMILDAVAAAVSSMQGVETEVHNDGNSIRILNLDMFK